MTCFDILKIDGHFSAIYAIARSQDREDRDLSQVIYLHPSAPAKPAEGQPCNGCGVCCATAPCPVGVLRSRRIRGRCSALVWNSARTQYRCGLIDQPHVHLPRWLGPAAPLVATTVHRYIAAGAGCDCNLDAVRQSHPDFVGNNDQTLSEPMARMHNDQQ